MKTLKKSLEILDIFLSCGKELSITELSKITGQNVSTIHNILTEYCRKGYISQEKKRGRYCLGLKFSNYNGSINKIMAIANVFYPSLLDLSKNIKETLNIAIRDGYTTNDISLVNSINRMYMVLDTHSGFKKPLYCTGVGKIFLAQMTNEELEAYFRSEQLISFTAKTIVSKDSLFEQIRVIRRDDIAFDFGESDISIQSVASPVRDYSGKTIAAVGIVGPSNRLNFKKLKILVPPLQKCAANISKLMGYHG